LNSPLPEKSYKLLSYGIPTTMKVLGMQQAPN